MISRTNVRRGIAMGTAMGIAMGTVRGNDRRPPISACRALVVPYWLAIGLLAMGAFWQPMDLPQPIFAATESGTGTSDLQPTGAGMLEILAGGDLRGEIKPCGCSPEGQIGGLPRRLTFLAQAFAAERDGPRPILLDTGNNFPEPSDQGRPKIDLIQTLLNRDRPEAILPGPNELAMGTALLDPGLPYMVSNDAMGKAFAPFLTVERAGLRIGLFGYISPEVVYQMFSQQYRLESISPAWLERVAARIASEGHDRTILLFRGNDLELETLAASGLFDRIIVGNPLDDELNQVTTRRVAAGVFPQVPTKGQGLYRIPLAGGPPVSPGVGTVVWLTDEFADHPAALAAFEEYDGRVKGLFFARLETLERQNSASPYAGAATCAACHPKANDVWSSSRHAHALPSLEAVGKQFDPECVACHVVGMERGGFLSQDLTPQLAGVQCENCHGPAKAHATQPMAVKPDRIQRGAATAGTAVAVCRDCHVGSHSPVFAFGTYWEKIAH